MGAVAVDLAAGRLAESLVFGPGTNGETPPIAPNAAQVAQRTALAQRLKADGWSPGLCYLAAQRI